MVVSFRHPIIIVSSSKHHVDDAKFLERMTIANLDSFIAFKSSGEIDFPLSRFSSSRKDTMPFCFKATYRWSVKLVRVSSPLKLRKTSYFHRGVEDENDDDKEAF